MSPYIIAHQMRFEGAYEAPWVDAAYGRSRPILQVQDLAASL